MSRGRETLSLAALLALVTLGVTWPILTTPGLPYQVDLSGFFPLTTDAYEARFWPAWNEHGGMSTLQFLPALLLELPFMLVGHALDWGMDTHIKARIVLGLFTAALGMALLVRRTLGRDARFGSFPVWLRLALPLAPALLYAFNPWSIHRIFHYFLWVGYVLAPFLVILLERLVERPSARRAFAFAATFALATTDPHNPPYLALLLAPLVLLRLWQAWRTSRVIFDDLFRTLALAGGAYVAFSLHWVLPYAWNVLNNPGFGPPYVMSDQMLATLSQNGSFADVVRLLHNYQPRAPLAWTEGPVGQAWRFASFAVPLIAFNALLLSRRGETFLYAGMALVAILLGMGTNLGGLYTWAVFDSPLGEGLSWLFRDPYRWGGIQAFAYAMLIGHTLFEAAAALHDARPRFVARALPMTGPALAVCAIVLFSAPAIAGYMGDVYEPLEVPAAYYGANAFMDATLPEDAKVAWMPRILGATTWSDGKTLEYFDATSSSRASWGPFRDHTTAAYDQAERAAIAGGESPGLLARMGVGYVVHHADRDASRDAAILAGLEKAGFRRIATFGTTQTEVVSATGEGPAGTPAARVLLDGARTLEQTFVPTEDRLRVLTLRVQREGTPEPLVATLLDPEGNGLREFVLTPGNETREIKLELGDLSVRRGYDHALRLRETGVSEADGSGYAVSYAKVDTYPDGKLRLSSDGASWQELPGDAWFEARGARHGLITILESPLAPARVAAGTTLVASPDERGVLERLISLPAEGPLSTAGVLLTNADRTAASAFASNDADWTWLASTSSTRLDAVAPFFPRSSHVGLFAATHNADGKAEWARGTAGFAYYGWGWPLSLQALKQSRDTLDGGDGLLYTSANATLRIPLEPHAEDRIVLARVYTHPAGGTLRIEEAEVTTKAAEARFTWVEAATLPAGNATLDIANLGGFQGLDDVAVMTPAELRTARDAAARRLDESAYVLHEEALELPGWTRRVSLPGLGSFADARAETTLRFDAPKSGLAAVWLRMPASAEPPGLALDGTPLPGALACAAQCDGSVVYRRASLGELEAGAHTLTLAPPKNGTLIDLVLLASSDAPLLAPTEPGAWVTGWERQDAATFRVHVDGKGPLHIVLREAMDPGWRAQSLNSPIAYPPHLVDGATTGFIVHVEGPDTFTVRYQPHDHARVGAALTALSLAAAFAYAAWPRRALPSARGDAEAREEAHA